MTPLTGFDLFDDVEDTAPQEPSVSSALQELKRDDIITVGGVDWLVFQPQGVQVYVTKAGTKGKKFYVIMPIDRTTVGVYQVLGGGSHFDKEPTVTGEL